MSSRASGATSAATPPRGSLHERSGPVGDGLVARVRALLVELRRVPRADAARFVEGAEPAASHGKATGPFVTDLSTPEIPRIASWASSGTFAVVDFTLSGNVIARSSDARTGDAGEPSGSP